MDWDAFERGNLAVFCADADQAEAFLEACRSRGMDTRLAQEGVHRYTGFRYSYRFATEYDRINFLTLGHAEPWDSHVANGFTSSICRYIEVCAELDVHIPNITSLDGLL